MPWFFLKEAVTADEIRAKITAMGSDLRIHVYSGKVWFLNAMRDHDGITVMLALASKDWGRR
jgi:hypothetical protein